MKKKFKNVDITYRLNKIIVEKNFKIFFEFFLDEFFGQFYLMVHPKPHPLFVLTKGCTPGQTLDKSFSNNKQLIQHG